MREAPRAVSSSEGSSGVMDTSRDVAADDRMSAPSPATTCAWGGCSGVATATSGLFAPLTAMRADAPFAPPGLPAGGLTYT